MRSEEPWVPPIVVALLLGGALFWLSREADRLGTAGWWTFALLTAALLVLLGGPARTVLLWAGALALGGLLMLGWAILVPPPGAGPGARLDDLLLGRGMAAPTFLGAWLVVFATLLIVVVAVVRGTLGHPVVAVAAAAVAVVMTPLLGTAVAEPVHRVQAGFLVDHTTADHPRVTGTTTDGPSGPLRKQWSVKGNAVDLTVVGDTVITYRSNGVVALDATTGTERWRYRTTDEAPQGAVIMPSAGVLTVLLDEIALLLDVGSGEQVAVLRLPRAVRGWHPVGEDTGDLVTTGRLAVLGDGYGGFYGQLIAIDPTTRTVTTVEEHAALNCTYQLANDDPANTQYLVRSGCGPTVVTGFHDGDTRTTLTIPGTDCAESGCEASHLVADRDQLTFVHRDGVRNEIVSTNGLGIRWRLEYEVRPSLYPIPYSPSYQANRVAVLPNTWPETPSWQVVEVDEGRAAASADAPRPSLVARDRWFSVDRSIVTSIDTTTWQVVGRTDVGCAVTGLRGGGRHVVAMCRDGRLVGLSDT